MAWDYELNKHYRVKAQKEYPWPCKPEPKRKVELFPFDVLTKAKDGTVTKHTGLCMMGIVVPDCDLEEITEPTRIAVGSMFSNVAVEGGEQRAAKAPARTKGSASCNEGG